MVEHNQLTMDNMDNITAVKPALADAGSPAEPSSNEHTIEPLDLVENPKARTKLRIYAILVSLYVHCPLSSWRVSSD